MISKICDTIEIEQQPSTCLAIADALTYSLRLASNGCTFKATLQDKDVQITDVIERTSSIALRFFASLITIVFFPIVLIGIVIKYIVSIDPTHAKVWDAASKHLAPCPAKTGLEDIPAEINIMQSSDQPSTSTNDSEPITFDQHPVKYLLLHPAVTYSIAGRSYKIVNHISSRGVFGDVFLAQDQQSSEYVAIKIIRNNADKEHENLQRVQNHGGHPHIVKYIGSEKLMDKQWIVMEYIDGETYRDYCLHSEWNDVLAKQEKSAKDFLKKIGVHREEENEGRNIMITKVNGEPRVKLIDFGTLITEYISGRI